MQSNVFTKKEIVLLSIFTAVLTIPRILLYFVLGHGLVGTDGQARYIPQAQQLSLSFSHFFALVGPFYSTILMLLYKFTHDYVTGPVILQHILGIITALLIYFYVKKVNLPLAVAVALIVYAGLFSLFMEHYILREAVTAFLMVSMVFLLTLAAKETKYMKLIFGLLTGLTGVLLVLTRIELVVVVILVPVVLFIARKTGDSGFHIRNMAFWKWTCGYYLLLAAVAIIAGAMSIVSPGQTLIVSPYGSYTTVAYYNLKPNAFNYENSRYPELLKMYQAAEAKGGNPPETVMAIQEATIEYLNQNPTIKLSISKMMDRMYFEGLTKNPGPFLWSVAANLGNQLMGKGEAGFLTQTNIKMGNLSVVSNNSSVIGVTDISKATPGTGKTGFLWSIVNMASQIYSTVWGLIYRVLSSAVFAWLLILSAVYMFIKWKKLPAEIIVSFLICAIVFATITIIANPIHRFRYPVDPLMYFLQLYLIYLMVKQIYTWSVRAIRARLHPVKVTDNVNDVS
jgi:hypothetical protein